MHEARPIRDLYRSRGRGRRAALVLPGRDRYLMASVRLRGGKQVSVQSVANRNRTKPKGAFTHAGGRAGGRMTWWSNMQSLACDRSITYRGGRVGGDVAVGVGVGRDEDTGGHSLGGRQGGAVHRLVHHLMWSSEEKYRRGGDEQLCVARLSALKADRSIATQWRGSISHARPPTYRGPDRLAGLDREGAGDGRGLVELGLGPGTEGAVCWMIDV